MPPTDGRFEVVVASSSRRESDGVGPVRENVPFLGGVSAFGGDSSCSSSLGEVSCFSVGSTFFP